jgi:predicted transcriptional regulator
MTGPEFCRLLDEAGLRPNQFSDLAGVHFTTTYRWLRKGNPPPWVPVLLKLFIKTL